LEKGKDRMKPSLSITKIDGFLSFIPPLNANVLFLQVFFKNLTLCMTKLRVLVLCFFLTLRITLLCHRNYALQWNGSAILLLIFLNAKKALKVKL
jgi:hypothetical protein